MKSQTRYLTFETRKRRELVRITEEVAALAATSGIQEGMERLKNLLLGHQVIVPITRGRLDLGPWQQVFYYEFDGRRPKRLLLKAMGE